MFLKKKGCILDKKLFNILYKDWETVHRPKKINLNKKNTMFFNNNVTRKYDHDELHEFFAFYDQPLHTKIRPNLDKAWCSEKMWNNLSYEDQIKCALEECYVIATERYYLRGYPPKISKSRALKDMITEITKGWFNFFLIDNFEKLLHNELDDFWFNKLKEIEK